MSLLYIDGFDTYGNTDGQDVYPAMAEAGWIMEAGFNAEPNPKTFADTRTGIGWSITPIDWVYGGTLRRAFPTCAGIVAGFAVKLRVSKTTGLCQVMYNNLIGTIYPQIGVAANGSNGITVTSGNGVYTSPPNVLFENVWQFVEIKYSPGVSTSYLEVRVDGVAVITVVNQPLQDTRTAALVNMFQLDGGGRGETLVDDLYLCNTSGSNFNNFLGDCVVHSLAPISDATPNAMTQHGGVTGEHFSNVAELPPDDDTSYLSSNTSGDKELYGLSAITADVLQVLAVSVNVTARKQAPGFGSYKACIVTGGVEADSPTKSAALAYIQTQFPLETQPNGSPWTNAALQGSKIGFFLP